MNTRGLADNNIILPSLKESKRMGNHVCGIYLISLSQTSRFFETYSKSVKHFMDHYFIHTPFNEEARARAIICVYIFILQVLESELYLDRE